MVVIEQCLKSREGKKRQGNSGYFSITELVGVEKNVRVPEGLGLVEAVAETATFAFGR